MNKRAAILYYIVIIGFAMAFGSFLLYTTIKNPEQQKSYAGEPAMVALMAAQTADKMLLYADAGTTIAAHDAMMEVAQKGGYLESSCPTYFGYNVWKRGCVPKIDESFELAFNQHMDGILQKYPDQNKLAQAGKDSSFFLSPKMGSSYYKLFTHGNELVGSRATPVTVEIHHKQKTTQLVGEYTIYPNVRMKTAYNFDNNRFIAQKLKKLLDTSSQVDLPALFAYWQDQSGMRWQLQACASQDEKEVFYAFAERIQDCVDTAATNCGCSFEPPTLLGDTYGIFFEQDDGNVVVRLRDIKKPESHILEYKIERYTELSFRDQNEIRAAAEVAFFWNQKPFLQIETAEGLMSPAPVEKIQFFKGSTLSALANPLTSDECPLPEKKAYRICVNIGELPDKRTVNFKIALDLS